MTPILAWTSATQHTLAAAAVDTPRPATPS